MGKRGLGKGLDALFQTYDNDQKEKTYDNDQKENAIKEIRISEIDPNSKQPRKDFNENRLSELADSIKKHGVIQPIIVKKNNNRYLIIAGERRWRASRIAGIKKIPAIIREMDNNKIIEIALIENLQREDLNPIEEAEGIKSLIDEFGLKQEEIAERIGKSRSAITNTLRLLSLPKQIMEYLKNEKITPGHGRALAGIKENDKKLEICQVIIEKDLSVRETEKLIKNLKKNANDIKTNPKKEKPNYILELEENLEESLGTRVLIMPGKKKGKIEIEYYNNEDLERILNKITQKKDVSRET